MGIKVNFGEAPIINKGFYDINPVLFGFTPRSINTCGPAVRDYYLIHYVRCGSGFFENSERNYLVKKGDIFIILPGEITTYYSNEDDPWTYTCIGFNGAQAKRLKTVKKRVIAYRKNTFYAMMQFFRINNTREEFLTSKIYEILSVIFDSYVKAKSNYVNQADTLIKATFMQDITAESISNTIGINRAYLTRLMIKETGYGLQEYIIKTRLDYAKELLSYGYSVKETAQLSGFNDTYNFSKIFHKKLGISPSAYKSK